MSKNKLPENIPPEKRSAGRPKGSPNKNTALLKDAILKAAEQAGNDVKKGGGVVAYLKKQAKESPRPFLALIGKVLPLTVAGDDDNPLTIIERVIVKAKD